MACSTKDLRQRLRAQWTDAVKDWIGQDQSVRTGIDDELRALNFIIYEMSKPAS